MSTAPTVRRRESKHSEAVGHVSLHPGAQLRCALCIFVHGLAQTALGIQPIRRFEDGPQIGGYLAAHLEPRHIVTGILLQMKLAALPGQAGKAGLPRRFQAGMIVADQLAHVGQSARPQAGEKVSPVHLRFARRHAHPQYRAMPAFIDSKGHQYGAGDHRSAPCRIFS